jgi:hypothetical protein
MHRTVALLVVILGSAACYRGDPIRRSGAAPPAKAPSVEAQRDAPHTEPGPTTGGFRCAVLVRGPGGNPLPGTRMDLVREDGGVVASEVADGEGIARFRVPGGNYTVRMRDSAGALLAEVGYEISGDTPTPIEVVLGRK